MPDVPPDQFFLGADVDSTSGDRTEHLTAYDPDDLVTHGVIVGMTGSGKTGLGVVLLEEALLHGIPCLVIDPKGDLGNLALTFPALQAEQFLPWVDERQAAKEGITAEALAARTAGEWTAGLASWGMDGARIGELRNAAPVTLYTPGSTVGMPLNLVGSLHAPPAGTDEETLHDEIEGFVSALLGLAGIDADPLASPEHILLTNLIADAWTKGKDLDLAGLLALVADPPLRKLGVLDLDTFFPATQRMGLVLRLNGLLASPSFQAWSQGLAVDFDTLLHRADGGPRAAVIGLSHLSDAERQFVVTLLCSKLVTWMRRQSGTTSLRALVYMDEVFGFVPPNGMPPAKKPILTILKQARAFGVGMVLATQNPVDLDYKALSNAGTWMIGRLQTERDKARLVDGLTAASGSVDLSRISDTISTLGKRQFVLQRAGSSGPKVFTTRWALSYLRGPLDRHQIRELAAADHSWEGTEAGPTRLDEPPPSNVDALADDETSLAPQVAAGIPVSWLDAAAPWAGIVGATAGSTQIAAAMVARVQLRFNSKTAELDAHEEWEAVLFPVTDPADWAAAAEVDHDARDFRAQPPAGDVRYVLGDAPLDKAAFFRSTQKRLVDHLKVNEEVTLLRNKALRVLQRPTESVVDFQGRVEAAADARSDEEAVALRQKLTARADKLRDAMGDAQARVEDLEAEQRRKRTGGLIKAAGGLLGAFLGGKRSSRSLARTISSAAGNVVRGPGTASLDSAQQRVSTSQRDLAKVEDDLAAQLVALDEKWTAVAQQNEPFTVGLTAGDITVEQLSLCWVPVG